MRKTLSAFGLTFLLLILTFRPAQAFDITALGCAVNALLGDARCVQEHAARFAGDMVLNTITAVSVGIGGAGTETLNIPETSSLETAEGEYNPYLRGGALGAVAMASDTLYDNLPNIRTGDFFRQALANNILNIQPAYGQSTGVDILNTSGIMTLWKVFRNISYIFMVIVLLAFGLMVIFRYRTDPRTVVTFQMAIPRVAVSLVLITFSYPIGGFLMDLSTVLTELARSILTPVLAGIGRTPINTGLWKIWQEFVFTSVLNFAIGYWVIEVIFWLIIRAIAFFIAFQIFWILISRYAMLFVQVIIAPLQFLWGTLPGQEEHTTRWFRSFLVNILVFPAIFLIANIASYIRALGVGGTGIPMPPAFLHPHDISGLVALGVLATAPKVPAILEDALDVTPSGHVAKAGVEPRSVLKSIPMLGRMF